jgi:hypothetical protein
MRCPSTRRTLPGAYRNPRGAFAAERLFLEEIYPFRERL